LLDLTFTLAFKTKQLGPSCVGQGKKKLIELRMEFAERMFIVLKFKWDEF